MRIIVPIRPRTIAEFKKFVQKINGRADVIEVWLDSFSLSSRTCFGISEMLNQVQHDKVSQDRSLKFLGVCKSPEERGTFAGTPEERIKVLQKFLDAGGDLVDLDVVRNEEKWIRKLPAKKLILSFHDFEKVPKNLEEIFAQMQKLNPRMYKFAVTTNAQPELENFLQFVKTFPKGQDAIFTTMGKLGREGRKQIENLKKSWGEFVAIDENHRTAEGQKTL